MHQGMQVAPVQRIQSVAINLQSLQRPARRRAIDLGAFGLGKITHAPQQAQRNTRGAPRPAGNLYSAIFCNGCTEFTRCRHDNSRQFFRLIELQPQWNSEPVAQRRRQKASPRGGADQREWR